MTTGFEVTATDPRSSARAGRILTPHGAIETPAFAPVASQGAVKALLHDQVEALGAQLILINAYHIYLRPGLETIGAAGGVHKFISWNRPILSDSGGFQIYSLSPLVKVADEGVRFSSHLDGTKIFLSPEDVVDIQQSLGTDIMMALDYFLPYPSAREKMAEAVRTTSLWARRARDRFREKETPQHLWGISQGSVYWDLRRQSLEELLEIGFDGYALGGLGIGEPKAELLETLEKSDSLIPFILVFVIFYLLIVMPQKNRQKKHQNMVEQLKPGDQIITSGGVYGTIMGVQPDRIELKVAANVKIDITKSSVAVILKQQQQPEVR